MKLMPGRGLMLKQERYTHELLEKFRCNDLIPSDYIMTVPEKKDDKMLQGPNPFASMVGALLYLSTHTRPDIAYAVSVLARKMTKPTMEDLKAAIQVFMYLSKYPGAGLMFPVKTGWQQMKGHTYPGFQVFSDASFCEKPKSKSTSGMLVMYNQAPISWLSKQQSVVATSTCEAEYIAASTSTQEAMWLRKLTADIRGKTEPLKLYIDNEAAIKLVSDDAAYATGRTRHIYVRFHYVQEHVMKGEVLPRFVSTRVHVSSWRMR